MSFTPSNLANTPPGNITGNTLTTEQYRAAQTGLILQILDNLDHSNGKGVAVKRVQSGLDANKPTGGTAAGTVYVATDTGIVYYDDGTDLDVLGTLDNAQTWTALQTFSGGATIGGTATLSGGVSLSSAETLTSAGSIDASAASDTGGLKLPSKAGAAPTADGFLAFDTTSHTMKVGANGSTTTLGASNPTLLSGGGVAPGLANATNYAGIFINATEANVQIPMTQALTLTRLYVQVVIAPGAGQSIAFTVRKNGVDTTITCTIAAAAVTANDTAHSVTFAAGDLFSLKAVGSAGAAANQSMVYQVGT